MDFFDKLSKKATETYQVAKEKTQNVSEELKLKNKVNGIEEKNFELFAEIGEMVYNELKDGKDAEKEVIMTKVDIISANKDEMEKLKAQIRDLKNLKKCVNCGEELDKNASFCSKCGTAQPEVVNEAPSAMETEVVDINDSKDE